MMRLKLRALLIAFSAAAALQALPPSTMAATETFASKLGGCRIACDNALLDCQKNGGKHCSRDYQSCRADCDPIAQKRQKTSWLDDVKRKQRLCEQRCDFSSASCSSASPANRTACELGKQQCYTRCDPHPKKPPQR